MDKENVRPHEIFRYITEGGIAEPESYTYIIMGRPGPTGKSRLCTELNKAGFKAFEISESIYKLVEYSDDRNHLIVDSFRRHVAIVLNRNLRD